MRNLVAIGAVTDIAQAAPIKPITIDSLRASDRQAIEIIAPCLGAPSILSFVRLTMFLLCSMALAWTGTLPSNAIACRSCASSRDCSPMIGLTEGGAVERLSKPLYRIVLGILRPAESAVRRLIIVAARDIVVEPSPKRPVRQGVKSPAKAAKAKASQAQTPRVLPIVRPAQAISIAAWPLQKDAPRPSPASMSSISIRGFPCSSVRQQPPRAPRRPLPTWKRRVDDDTVNARHLFRRLAAIRMRCKTSRARRMRLARWRARPVEERRPQRSSPFRPGRPPGFRQRPKHEVDEILKECHWLARNVAAAARHIVRIAAHSRCRAVARLDFKQPLRHTPTQS